MEQFNDDRFFQYPPFNRHHTWRRDYEYEVPVVSSVGSGPKGEKGDTFKYDDMTPAELEEFGQLLIDSGAAAGKSAYEIAKENAENPDDPIFDDEATWVASLKGEKGDQGEFAELDQEELTQVYNTLRGQLEDWVRNRITGMSVTEQVAYARPTLLTDGSTGVTNLMIDMSGIGAFYYPAISDTDIFILSTNGLILQPAPRSWAYYKNLSYEEIAELNDYDYCFDNEGTYATGDIYFLRDISDDDEYDSQTNANTVCIRRIVAKWQLRG